MAGAALLAACGRADYQPALTAAGLTGTWTGNGGGTISFSAGKHFTANGIQLNAAAGRGCAHVSGSGTWDFLKDGASATTPVGYSSGSQINLGFLTVAGTSTRSCVLTVQMVTWEPHPPLKLCMSFDLDNPCGGELFTKHA